ncbi:hypothetical protein B0T16DRAFT_325546 [Cercophora newfieldiana]|uniref:Rhodopsin domain-containing protein n=1 Tax=Cercophora newfieldiana TaxID=92897 RepID=A0AA40CRH8_9PEZI|nr:hypothetical protein B0T16DRAFT_325546 [Cercophora newfieldiana]
MSSLLASSLAAAEFAGSTFASTPLGLHSARRNGTSFRGHNRPPSSSNRTVQSTSGSSPFRVSQMEDYGPQVNFIIWLLTAVSAAFLALRVYCKFLRHRGLWWDDHVLIASWVGALQLCTHESFQLIKRQLSLVISNSCVSVAINMGFGRPLSQFNMKLLNEFLLITNIAGSFSILAACWSKTSFAITVLRISSGWVKMLIWFIIITVNLSLGAAVAITWGQCTPIEKTWQPNLDGQCWPKDIQIWYNIFTAIYSGTMDIVLAIIPWKVIWTLTMNKKEKFGVLVAMSMGIFAGITSIIKLTQLPTISNANFTDSPAQLVILGCAEGAITIIAASIPILRALLRDGRPPPGPADFYHSFDMYTGTENSRGTGRNSTVITSGSRTGSRTASRTSRDFHPTGHFRQLSKLSHMSGLSLGFITNRSGPNSNRNSETGFDGPEPPPGRILKEEEIMIEYEPTQAVVIGKAM